jgi:hypothetical protein
MEPLESMRNKEFKSAKVKVLQIRDSRFGLRKLFLTDKEKPSIGAWNRPGRGPNGESQN